MSKKPYILVADDDEAFQFIISSLLSEKYEVKTVSSGQRCLDAIRERKPNLLLLDIHMSGMSGFDVLLELHENQLYQDLPIIFLTATPKHKLDELPVDLKASDYLIKPCEEDKLLAKIKKIIT